MDTNKHTSGPWTCKHGDAISNHISADDGKIMVAAVYNIHTDVGCHNAMLIRAAPDMLAALESLLAHPTTADADSDEAQRCQIARNQARAAIRKATGAATC
jgi:hypothetical protein